MKIEMSSFSGLKEKFFWWMKEDQSVVYVKYKTACHVSYNKHQFKAYEVSCSTEILTEFRAGQNEMKQICVCNKNKFYSRVFHMSCFWKLINVLLCDSTKIACQDEVMPFFHPCVGNIHRECSTHGKDEKHVQNFSWKT